MPSYFVKVTGESFWIPFLEGAWDADDKKERQKGMIRRTMFG
jgi:hypothetical protein